MYEPIHGSAPDIAGQGIANPIATILSFSMALKYSLNLDKESKELDSAVQKILDDGLRTKDIYSKGNKEVSTKDIGDAVIACLQKQIISINLLKLMTTYTAPVDDMMFLYEKLRNDKSYNEIDKYKDVTPDLVKNILEEAAKINENIILPLAKSGDENPTVLENGIVRTPPGYKEAYQKYIEDGWTSLSCDPKYGGQGMPKTVSAFFDEMLSSASLSFKLYSELSIGAYNCINHHASDEIKNKYIPKMVEGKWSGTMCLTEPVCGTDLGLLKTKADKQSDGTYTRSSIKEWY